MKIQFPFNAHFLRYELTYFPSFIYVFFLIEMYQNIVIVGVEIRVYESVKISMT